MHFNKAHAALLIASASALTGSGKKPFPKLRPLKSALAAKQDLFGINEDPLLNSKREGQDSFRGAFAGPAKASDRQLKALFASRALQFWNRSARATARYKRGDYAGAFAMYRAALGLLEADEKWRGAAAATRGACNHVM